MSVPKQTYGLVQDRCRPLLWVVWARSGGRAVDMADHFGGHPVILQYRSLRRSVLLVPVRWSLSAIHTFALLIWRRPRAVVVQYPPALAGIVVALLSRILGYRYVLDSHPRGFGDKGDTWSKRLLPLHRYLARRAALVCVAHPDHRRVVESWGVTAQELHEPPPKILNRQTVRDDRDIDGPLHVLVATTFDGDDPIEVLNEVASLMPQASFHFTGTPDARASRMASNVHLEGFLPYDDYLDLMQGSDLVIALSTEDRTVMRAAYEATYHALPLVTTESEASRQFFTRAALTANRPEDVVKAITRACLYTNDHLAEGAEAARRTWQGQEAAVASALGLPGRGLPIGQGDHG
jgi:hypothetical protein